MKDSKILIHIPHTSLIFPKIFREKIQLSIKDIEEDNAEMSDLYVDKLIELEKYNNVKFKYSRLFCDVERFKDDNIEPMTQKGMGSIYTSTYNKKQFFSYDSKYKDYVVKNFYDKHHKKLSDMVTKIIKRHKECIIIDLHSFSDKLVNNIFNLENNPDICIGYDNNFIDDDLLNFTISYFENKGYSVKTNYPYSGSMIPTEYYLNKDRKIKSIMLELNKRIYLINNEIEVEKFSKLKIIMGEYLSIINEKY